MRCSDPVLSYRSKKTRIFRHFSLSNEFIKAIHQQVFNCGKCIFCRKMKAAELAMRCVLNASLYEQNSFLTLTYDETKPDYHNRFHYKDIQDFKKRLRSYVQRHYNKRIEIFNVHEYGKNGKKHWHLILFNHDFQDKELFTVKNGNNLYTSKQLEILWPYGFNTIGDVTTASAMYQAQYTQKDFKHGYENSTKKSHSVHRGIGRSYFLKHYQQILTNGYIPFNGGKAPIPRYFQKLAHKHYSYFHVPQNFFDSPDRKRLYTPFKEGEANIGISDSYQIYLELKQKQLDKRISDWEDYIDSNLFNTDTTGFQQSEKNYLHDLKRKQNLKEF